MKKLLCFLISGLFVVGVQAQSVSIIPKPVSLQLQTGSFVLDARTVITARNEADRRTAGLLNEYLQQVYGFKLDIDRAEGKNYIRLGTRTFIKAPDKDAYQMTINKDGVTIEGDTYTGTFYGVQTLMQLFSNDAAAANYKLNAAAPLKTIRLPYLTISDHPRFNYRGMHLDVCRHFFPVSFLKKYIDYLAYHKFNYFHWHLTDDQGWRIEIDRYPELTRTGAYRNGTIVGRYPGTSNDNKRYGGFYTKAEAREIVQYAMDRHITVIPEIEMPGHSSAAIAAYPWLSCFPEQNTKLTGPISEASQQAQAAGKAKIVQETWGVFEDIYCGGNDSTFQFLENVLEELLPVFPSRYIHVGGDEAPKNHWKKCPRCQARIRNENLKDEHGLQSYFIQRMEKFLNSRDRILIGWDEILEGGLAPNAWVMSWRGEKGGIEAAKAAHSVIMTPQKPVYFDHTQTRNEDSLVIGGYNPLEAVYAYEPVPKELDSASAKYVIGAQANLWTEYIPTPSKVEYMIFPRMSALSEVLWTPAASRNWTDFQNRMPLQFLRYEQWGANYSRAFYDLRSTLGPVPKGNGVQWKLRKATANGLIVYEMPGGKRFASAADSIMLPIKEAGAYKVWLVEGTAGKNKGSIPLPKSLQPINAPFTQTFFLNKAFGKKVTMKGTPNDRYPGQGGAFSMVNGIYSNKGLSHPDWLGFIGDDIEATIDLGKSTPIDSVRMHTIVQPGSWVYQAQYIEVFLSNDGKKFTSAGRSSEFVKDTLTMGFMTLRLPQRRSARYVKLVAKNYGLIPEGQPGAGTKSWIFTDEVQVF